MKMLLIITTLLITAGSLPAQSVGRSQILRPVHQVFRAMAAGDSSLLAESFHPDVRLTTVAIDPSGSSGISLESSIKPFQTAIVKAGPGVFYEPIHHIRISRQGPYAEVWARYDFYLRGKFHHCGVDSFQLVKTASGWKIIQLTDTRETAGCRPRRRFRPDH